MDLLRDFTVGRVLLFLTWERVPVHIEKLRAIKSNPLRAVGRDRLNIARKLNVGRKHDVAPVAGG